MQQTQAAASRWSSRFGFIMAATGAAVGLGNIWKFPYMVGENGGSAFVLVYLISVALIGIPLLLAEVMLGRMGRANPVNAFTQLSRRFSGSKHWRMVGWLGSLTLLMVLSFYSVVSGWSLQYLWHSFFTSYAGQTPADIQVQWSTLLAQPYRLLLWHSVFMGLTLGTVAWGVKKGIERLSRFMMPALFLILIVLCYAGLTEGNFAKAYAFLMDFRWETITGKVAMSAVGHAFFTLAIGAGCMMVYGAYLPKETKLGPTLIVISALDVLVAFLAGFAIFPLVFEYGLSPEGGPGLMFQVLPVAFGLMPFGQGIAILFFTLLLFAAWTSSISMAEPLIFLLVEKTKLSRRMACVVIGLLAWGIGIISLLSFNVWSAIRVFDRFPLFTVMTDLPTNILLPLGGLAYAIFAGYVVSRKAAKEELAFKSIYLYYLWRILIRIVVPVGIVIVFVSTVWG